MTYSTHILASISFKRELRCIVRQRKRRTQRPELHSESDDHLTPDDNAVRRCAPCAVLILSFALLALPKITIEQCNSPSLLSHDSIITITCNECIAEIYVEVTQDNVKMLNYRCLNSQTIHVRDVQWLNFTMIVDLLHFRGNLKYRESNNTIEVPRCACIRTAAVFMRDDFVHAMSVVCQTSRGE